MKNESFRGYPRYDKVPDRTTDIERRFYLLVAKVALLVVSTAGILFLLSGCAMTEKTATRKVLRVHAAHKNVLDRWCAEWNPISVKSDTTFAGTYDTTFTEGSSGIWVFGQDGKYRLVHGDSNILISSYPMPIEPVPIDHMMGYSTYDEGPAQDSFTGKHALKIKCPPQYLVRHFPLQTIRTTVENTAAADSARASSRKFQLEAVEQASVKKVWKGLFFGACGLVALLIVGVVLFWKFKLKDIVK